MKQKILLTCLLFMFQVNVGNAEGVLSSHFVNSDKPPRSFPVPPNQSQYLQNEARVFFDANEDGRDDLFLAVKRLDMVHQKISDAPPSDFLIYTANEKGVLQIDGDILDGVGKGCIYPRAVAANDFNGDGKIDIFVSCFGWDREPWPGERNKVVLSRSDGKYEIRDASREIGAFHGVASADFNGDGMNDVLVTNNFDSDSAVKVWLGDGNGGFRVTKKNLPKSIRRQGDYFSVQLLDVDGDDQFDLFAAGHEFAGVPTQFFLNGSQKGFKSKKSVTVPKVEDEGTVLDAVATGPKDDRILWILRTSGGNIRGYMGVCIQKYRLKNGESTLAHCDFTSKWFPWLISWKEGDQRFIGSDDASNAIRVQVE